MAHAGLGEAPGQEVGAPRWEPSPEQVAMMRAATDMFLAHLLRPTTHYRPDVEALRAAPARIVVAAGDRITEITGFADPALFPAFGLPGFLER